MRHVATGGESRERERERDSILRRESSEQTVVAAGHPQSACKESQAGKAGAHIMVVVTPAAATGRGTGGAPGRIGTGGTLGACAQTHPVTAQLPRVCVRPYTCAPGSMQILVPNMCDGVGKQRRNGGWEEQVCGGPPTRHGRALAPCVLLRLMNNTPACEYHNFQHTFQRAEVRACGRHHWHCIGLCKGGSYSTERPCERSQRAEACT